MRHITITQSFCVRDDLGTYVVGSYVVAFAAVPYSPCTQQSTALSCPRSMRINMYLYSTNNAPTYMRLARTVVYALS